MLCSSRSDMAPVCIGAVWHADIAANRHKKVPTSGISWLPTERFTNKYGVYVVFKNLVMLCETELATCKALIARSD